jgi:hypothetical protein
LKAIMRMSVTMMPKETCQMHATFAF